tara:strand:+ start:1318 stop:2169 length:852 start_codon:yes stop_codon:yes gene_type:complete
LYPIIVDFGIVNFFGFEFRLAIYSFGLMLVIAFYSCYFLLDKDLKQLGYDEKLASDIIFWSALGGIIGSKIYHVIENLDQILSSNNPLEHIFSGSGLVFLGGLIGAIIAVSIILKKYGVSWLFFADRLAPLILLGYAIGRIGCFLVGDDYGIPSDLPWAVSFPNGLPPTTSYVFTSQFPWIDISKYGDGVLTVHPTQLYETFICFGLFYMLWLKRNTIKIQGSLFFQYLIFAGLERFLIEFFRTNEKYLFGVFSGAQILSGFMICIGLFFLINPLPPSEKESI